MEIIRLTYEEQLKVAEDLYNITDSIEAARYLENDYGIKIRLGQSVELNDFARKLDKTKFPYWQIENAIAKQTGHKIRLSSL